jgi:hypothetical protein
MSEYRFRQLDQAWERSQAYEPPVQKPMMSFETFHSLKEGQHFAFTNDIGMVSHWVVTGADGGFSIDADCTDDVPNQIATGHIFWEGDRRGMELL